jgi:hypothetical protein
MKFLLLLLLAIPVFSQSDLPDRGKLSDLTGKTKVYISADGEHYEAIEKGIKKQFKIADKASEADFILSYESLANRVVGPTSIHLEKGQLTAYYFRDKTKVIAWTQTHDDGAFKAATSKALISRFLKAWSKLEGKQ